VEEFEWVHRNLIRTRLQTQGTPAHPQRCARDRADCVDGIDASAHRYSGFREVVQLTYSREGLRGFYKVRCASRV
jgi:hypothetical protein